LFAAQPAIVENAEKLGVQLRKENGVEKAIRFITQQF
jgi:hypothetical protein